MRRCWVLSTQMDIACWDGAWEGALEASRPIRLRLPLTLPLRCAAMQYRFNFTTYGKGVQYEFKAKAKNAAGFGADSAAVSYTTSSSGA